MEVRSSRRMRTLVTRMARRGLSVNELETGYIDARPLTASSAKPLATRGRTIHPGSFSDFGARPSEARSSPNNRHEATAAACRFHARFGSANLFDYLICAGEQ